MDRNFETEVKLETDNDTYSIKIFHENIDELEELLEVHNNNLILLKKIKLNAESVWDLLSNNLNLTVQTTNKKDNSKSLLFNSIKVEINSLEFVEKGCAELFLEIEE